VAPIFLVLAYFFVFGTIGTLIGQPKGLENAGLFLGAALGPIGLIIIAVMEPTVEVRAKREAEVAMRVSGGPGEIRPCPWCAETIKRAAVVCRHCGRDVESVPVDRPAATTEQRVWFREITRYCAIAAPEARALQTKFADRPVSDATLTAIQQVALDGANGADAQSRLADLLAD
jgi:hypothetical protein